MAFNFLSCQCGKFVIPQRFILSFMLFLGILLSYSNRVCLHMAITEMVVPPPEISARSARAYGEICEYEDTKKVNVKNGTLNWSEDQQGLILSSFFFGYVITHIPGGIISDSLGGKYVLLIGQIITSISTLISPASTLDGNWYWLFIVRIVLGLGQGPLFPSVTALMAEWIPLHERSTLGALIVTGAHIGTIAGNLFSSSIIVATGNWSVAFYFWGVMGLLWSAIFFLTCYSDPSSHPFITPKEAAMLEETIGPRVKLPIPWKAILVDKAVWSLIIGTMGHDMIFFLILVQLPKYMSDVLKFNIEENGILSSIPYVGLWLCSIVSGYVADKVIAMEKISIVNIRRILTIIGHGCPAICVILASYMGCNRTAAAAMFVLALLTMGPFYPGMRINSLDISKNFAGVIMAITNGAGALTFIPVPIIIGKIAGQHTIEQWRLIFWMLFGAMFVTTTTYIILASGERAKWDKGPNE